MTGGIQIEYSIDGASPSATIASLKETIIDTVKQSLPSEQQAIITDSLVYQISGTNHIVVEAGIDESVAQVDGKADFPRIEAAKLAFSQ